MVNELYALGSVRVYDVYALHSSSLIKCNCVNYYIFFKYATNVLYYYVLVENVVTDITVSTRLVSITFLGWFLRLNYVLFHTTSILTSRIFLFVFIYYLM